MRLLAMLMVVLVEAAVAGDWVGLMAFDKEVGQGSQFREVRERQAMSMREATDKEGLSMRGSKGMLMENGRETPGNDLREDVEAEGLQCLQEELLLCTDQLTSALKRCKISYCEVARM